MIKRKKIIPCGSTSPMVQLSPLSPTCISWLSVRAYMIALNTKEINYIINI